MTSLLYLNIKGGYNMVEDNKIENNKKKRERKKKIIDMNVDELQKEKKILAEQKNKLDARLKDISERLELVTGLLIVKESAKKTEDDNKALENKIREQDNIISKLQQQRGQL